MTDPMPITLCDHVHVVLHDYINGTFGNVLNLAGKEIEKIFINIKYSFKFVFRKKIHSVSVESQKEYRTRQPYDRITKKFMWSNKGEQ